MRLLFLSLLLSGFFSFAQDKYQSPVPDPNPIKVYESQGVKVKSFDFKSIEPYLHKSNDTTYVINFWATWCLPCVKELPHFEQLNQSYSGKKVKVLLVSIDMPNKVETSLISFIKKKNIRSEILHLDDPDANAWIDKIDKNWSGAIPATLIYNTNNRAFYERSFTYTELENELLKIINK
nr:TlpA disulfide reductase family protein [uncultured Flavobacterium sp.]